MGCVRDVEVFLTNYMERGGLPLDTEILIGEVSRQCMSGKHGHSLLSSLSIWMTSNIITCNVFRVESGTIDPGKLGECAHLLELLDPALSNTSLGLPYGKGLS